MGPGIHRVWNWSSEVVYGVESSINVQQLSLKTKKIINSLSTKQLERRREGEKERMLVCRNSDSRFHCQL
jgi:hypothetical protein